MDDVLVVGSGAREHAILWGLSHSGYRGTLFAAPGNAGMAQIASCQALNSVDQVVQWAKGRNLLVIVGPEAPLAEGLADRLRADGHRVVGPGQSAARLESSKVFAKEVMAAVGIPTASSLTFYTYEELADQINRTAVWPQVLKQNGLAGGKGVVVATCADEARETIARWKSQGVSFHNGIVWEECLIGKEISVHVATNGRDYVWLPLTQDHKRLSEDPGSPNTGGMGAFGPVDGLKERDRDVINHEILVPLMDYLTEHGLDFRGILYVGLMLTAEGPKVLEFNVRLGDPEAEVIIPLLDVNWYDWWGQVAEGIVPGAHSVSTTRHAVAVVMASEGYPSQPVTGQKLVIPASVATEDVLIFHGATSRVGDDVVAQGGRVLTIVGLGDSRQKARARAYQAVKAVDFPNHRIRTDIAGNHFLD